MVKTKRFTSVLLTLCMVVVMLAGMLVFASVEVKAAATGIASVDFNSNGDSIEIVFIGRGFCISAGKRIIVSDDKGNAYTYQMPSGLGLYQSPCHKRYA